MRRICTLLIILCLLLTGCGKTANAEQRYSDFVLRLASAEALSFDAHIRAEYEDRTLSFTLACRRDAEGLALEIIEPELIAGIKAHIAAGETRLEYDGLILDTGALDAFGLSPVSALPALLDAMENGHIESYAKSSGETMYTLIPSDELRADVSFENESMTPVHAELISGGRVVVYCDIENWSMNDEGTAKEDMG